MFSIIQHKLSPRVFAHAQLYHVFFFAHVHRKRRKLCVGPFESKSIDMDENNSPRKKKRRLSLSRSKNRERFSVCTAEDVEAALKKKVPKNTLTAVNWAFQVFEDWVIHSNYVDGRCYKVEDLWSHEDPAKLCEMLAYFCLAILACLE